MTAIADRERLVRAIIRLRRAERTHPDEDLAAVRADLERAAGPTVSRALAARVLGVSQTALDRRIVAGDVPTVITRSGRREVPVGALVELAGAVEERRRAGDRHPLAAVLRAQRAAAARLSPRGLVPDGPRTGHRAVELRGLAYHRAVARRLDRPTVDQARERLARWREDGWIDPRYADAWEQVLSQSVPSIAHFIGEDSPWAGKLRQSSPFAGVLSEPERRRVLELTP